MSEFKIPLQDIQFALNEVLDFPQHYQQLPNSEDLTPDTIAAIYEEAAKFCEQVIRPLNHVGDEEGCHWRDGKVTTPSGFKAAYQKFTEGGWTGIAQEEKFGGQGLPTSINNVFYEMLSTSNHAWAMYPSLTWGAINTIRDHASEDLCERFLPSMVGGAWSGTMCLTEAHCGSDLGLLRTRAAANEDGSYTISGSKMFISAGQHDMTDNIVHIVLARLSDAPSGVKGISLFIVPKIWVNEDGSLGEHNNVNCGSIEHKMGIHGNATCVINFDEAKGFLIGPENKGLSCMFTFINESRLGVAQQGHGHIEASYQAALNYANERLQMRAPVRVLADKPADPIIAHPDVRRMLLTQKAFAEGGRLLNYYCAKLVDLNHCSEDATVRQQSENELALLTPIAKGFITEVSMEATQYGMQILGGHGYIREWGMEQEYRDTRITAIYEGTNGIQALDLLARKILPSGGEAMTSFVGQILSFCKSLYQPALKNLANLLEENLELWINLTQELEQQTQQDKNIPGAAAFDYMMIAGYTTLAYFLLKNAEKAENTLASNSNTTQYDTGFLQEKVNIAQFYFARILPRNASHASAIRSGTDNLMSWKNKNRIFQRCI